MERQHYIDQLRVITMMLVFVFHCMRFFDPLPWHLKNPQQHEVFLVFVGFLNGWFMELFFLLSGFAAWYALRRRTIARFIKERFLRLLLPIYTVGLLVILPPQRWWDLQTVGVEVGGFLTYYSEFLVSWITNPVSPFFLSPWPAHLWFLRFLFVISLFCLPLLLWFKNDSGQKVLDLIVTVVNKRAGIWLILPLLILLKILLPANPGEHSWNAMVTYAVYFLVGYVLAARPEMGQAFQRNTWTGLVLGFLSFGGIGAMLGAGFVKLIVTGQASAWQLALWNGVSALDTWAWLVFILGAGARWLNRGSSLLDRFNEAVLPFYILHQTVILFVGWWLSPWTIGIPAKLGLLFTLSLVLTVLCYEILVRPWNPARFLFGMRARP